MNEQTQDEFVRYRELKKIRTEEEYTAALKRLEYYKKEYTWMQETEDPLKEVKKELEALLPMFNGEKTESQKYFLRCINLLNAKSKQIQNGEYLPNLKRNITALVVTTREFEQRQREYKLSDILRGIIKRDKQILEALKIDNLFVRTMSFGKLPAEKDLSLQEPEYLVEYIGKNYNLVGIEVPEYKQNMSLVPINSEGKITPEQEFVSKMVTEYLEERRQSIPHISKHKGREKYSIEKEEKQEEQTKILHEALVNEDTKRETRKEKNEIEKGKKSLEEGEINQ